jgi:hypothetical protein
MRYAVLWNPKSLTLSIKDEGADSTNSAEVTDKSVGTVVCAEFGELPLAQPFPEIGEHLRNIARGLGFDPAAITVKNDTKNTRLAKYEVTGDKDLADGDKDTQASAGATMELGPDELITGEEGDVDVDEKAAAKQREQLADTHAIA